MWRGKRNQHTTQQTTHGTATRDRWKPNPHLHTPNPWICSSTTCYQHLAALESPMGRGQGSIFADWCCRQGKSPVPTLSPLSQSAWDQIRPTPSQALTPTLYHLHWFSLGGGVSGLREANKQTKTTNQDIFTAPKQLFLGSPQPHQKQFSVSPSSQLPVAPALLLAGQPSHLKALQEDSTQPYAIRNRESHPCCLGARTDPSEPYTSTAHTLLESWELREAAALFAMPCSSGEIAESGFVGTD